MYELIDEPIENVAECKLCVTVLEIVEGQLINKKKTKVTDVVMFALSIPELNLAFVIFRKKYDMN